MWFNNACAKLVIKFRRKPVSLSWRRGGKKRRKKKKKSETRETRWKFQVVSMKRSRGRFCILSPRKHVRVTRISPGFPRRVHRASYSPRATENSWRRKSSGGGERVAMVVAFVSVVLGARARIYRMYFTFTGTTLENRGSLSHSKTLQPPFFSMRALPRTVGFLRPPVKIHWKYHENRPRKVAAGITICKQTRSW